MIRVQVTEAELGGMTDFLDNYIYANKAKARSFAERALVSFLLAFNRMRYDGAIPKGAGWKIQSITKTYMAETMNSEYLFQLNNVTDRIKINDERLKHQIPAQQEESSN